MSEQVMRACTKNEWSELLLFIMLKKLLFYLFQQPFFFIIIQNAITLLGLDNYLHLPY